MSNNKKFWLCLYIPWVITVCAMGYGESKKGLSQDKVEPKYELKSDIINFDYTEMAYPFRDAKIGTDITLVENNVPPKKIVRAEGISNTETMVNSIVLPLLLVIAMLGLCIGITSFVIIISIITDYMKKVS